MNFMTKPCPDCPFLRGSSTNQTLTKSRMKEIATGMETGGTFTCHKTLDKPQIEQSHCGGALIYLENQDILYHNQMVRFADRLGLLNVDDIKKDDRIITPMEAKY